MEDSNGELIKRYNYDEFGNSKDIQDNEIGYTGYLYDEISNLNYAQTRFYDSSNGRFNGLDNIINNDETMLGFNRYVYVDNDPLNFIDRDGNIKSPTMSTLSKFDNPLKKVKISNERSMKNIPDSTRQEMKNARDSLQKKQKSIIRIQE